MILYLLFLHINNICFSAITIAELLKIHVKCLIQEIKLPKLL